MPWERRKLIYPDDDKPHDVELGSLKERGDKLINLWFDHCQCGFKLNIIVGVAEQFADEKDVLQKTEKTMMIGVAFLKNEDPDMENPENTKTTVFFTITEFEFVIGFLDKFENRWPAPDISKNGSAVSADDINSAMAELVEDYVGFVDALKDGLETAREIERPN